MTKLRTLHDIDVQGKKVLMRADFNVPLSDGKIQDTSRIDATLPTIRALLDKQATLILMSHLGRPKGEDDKLRLEPVAKYLSEQLGQPVNYRKVASAASEEQASLVQEAAAGSITLLENLRFDPREKKNDSEFAKALARYGDVYVNDAFGAAHRAHASTEGVAHLLPNAAGWLLAKEIEVLGRLVAQPEKPFKVILGGAKVSDKIGVMENLLDIVDEMLIGGAMAYTFIKAQGGEVGNSLVEEDKLELALKTLAQAKEKNVTIHLPQDSVCATEITAGIETITVPSNEIPAGYMGLDIGPAAAKDYENILQDAKTILWNGPLGVFEVSPFNEGTLNIARAVSNSNAYVVVGGGDSVAAIHKAKVAAGINHISTGGGASLEFLEGKTLPGVAVLSE